MQFQWNIISLRYTKAAAFCKHSAKWFLSVLLIQIQHLHQHNLQQTCKMIPVHVDWNVIMHFTHTRTSQPGKAELCAPDTESCSDDDLLCCKPWPTWIIQQALLLSKQWRQLNIMYKWLVGWCTVLIVQKHGCGRRCCLIECKLVRPAMMAMIMTSLMAKPRSWQIARSFLCRSLLPSWICWAAHWTLMPASYCKEASKHCLWECVSNVQMPWPSPSSSRISPR